MQGSELPDPDGWTLGALLHEDEHERIFSTTGAGATGRCVVARSPTARGDCERRSAALTGLTHPQITTVIAHGTLRGLPYRLDGDPAGPTAASWLERLGALGPAEVLGIGQSLATLLVDLHARGLVHGRLGPDSVHLDESDSGLVPVLAGFPLSLSSAGPSSDPAVHQGRAPDPRSDLFGLGIVLVSLLRGAAPSDKALETWSQAGSGPALAVPAGRIEPGLYNLLQALVDRDPDRRPRSAAEVGERLAALGGRRRPVLWPWVFGGAGGLVTALGLIITVMAPTSEAPSPEVPTPVAPIAEPTPSAQAPSARPEPTPAAAAEPEISTEPAPSPGAPAPVPTPASSAPAPNPRAAAPAEASPEAAGEGSELTSPPPAEPAEAPEPVLAELEPEPVEAPIAPAPPSAARFSGTWTGSANDRPLTLVLQVGEDGRASGSVEQRLGAQVLRSTVSGTCTAEGACTLTESAGGGTTWTGSFASNSASGRMSQRGKDRGAWSATR